MEKIRLILLFSLLLIVCVMACTTAPDKQVTVFAASGISLAVHSLKTNSNHTNLVVNAASSGTLARQIESGASADVYFSANYDWVKYLIDKAIVHASAVRIVAKNKLVVVSPFINAASESSIDMLLEKANRIAIGNPGYVPVGKYALDYLKKTDAFKCNETKFVEGRDVMSILKLVEMNEADLGFVYKSVAKASEKVTIVYEVPDSLCSPVNFYSVPLSDKGAELLNDNAFVTLLNEQLVAAGFELCEPKNSIVCYE